MTAYAARAEAGLGMLGGLFGVDLAASAGPAAAALFGRWGHRESRGAAAGSGPPPYEYSVALGDRAEIRLFFRPLAPAGDSSPAASWEQGWRTLDGLSRDHGVPLTRARLLADLFEPVSADAATGMCLAAAVEPGGVTGVKVYFDGMAQGVARNRDLMAAAMSRLGFEAAWRRLEPRLPAFLPSFSVDLLDRPDARAKLYAVVPDATSAEIEDRVAGLPGYAAGTAAAFGTALSARRDGALAGTRARPMLCWSMTAPVTRHPDDVTLYLPFREYVPDGRDARERLAALLPPDRLAPVAALGEHASGDGPPVNPFHWAAVKLRRAPANLTLYIGADLTDLPAGSAPGRARTPAGAA
ncbi:tryptophan dimethylallyltransferase family protein [Actinoplanes sp. NPDC051411]|uniref:tryptophan dimethylallyltransferase family protein n=1 Tax=Actinoplanes sp. NPDC051411 TaxID=3155522 RepID=UPI00343BAE69